MRWNPHHIPSYRRHRAIGQAVVTINARDLYLGPYNSKSSHELYQQLIKEWIANDPVLPATGNGFTIEELLAAFNEFAVNEYAPTERSHHTEYENYRAVMKLLRKLFPDTMVADFGPNKFRTVVEEMITRQWTRANINRQMGHRLQAMPQPLDDRSYRFTRRMCLANLQIIQHCRHPRFVHTPLPMGTAGQTNQLNQCGHFARPLPACIDNPRHSVFDPFLKPLVHRLFLPGAIG